MANHTIYVRDLAVWNKVKELAKAEGKSMSSIIEQEVRTWVMKQEKDNKMNEQLSQDEFTKIYLSARDEAKNLSPEALMERILQLDREIKERRQQLVGIRQALNEL